jgi:DmX-like protein
MEVRINKHKERITAHDTAVKCLAIGPNEDIYATGAADGDIRVRPNSSML